MLDTFLLNGPLYVDPASHVDLFLFVPLFREWQQSQGFAPWTAARIEIELGDRLGQRRENGRAIKTVLGVSKVDPMKFREERQGAVERQRQETAERERRKAELDAERVAREQRENSEAAKRLAAEKQRAAEFRLRLARAGVKRYIEYCPGHVLRLADIADKVSQEAADTIGHDLTDYRWYPDCVATDGRLKPWFTDENGTPLPSRSAGNSMYYSYDDPRNQLDPIQWRFVQAHNRYINRLVAPGQWGGLGYSNESEWESPNGWL
jgi:hypothetical protein